MSDSQSIAFIVPAGDLEMVKATIRRAYPNALVGFKLQANDTALLAVTLYSDHPVSERDFLALLGDRVEILCESKPALSMSEMVEKVKKARDSES